MPTAIVWTHARDHTLASLRAGGRSWDAVAAAMGIARWTAIERAKRIGAYTERLAPVGTRPDPLRDPARPPLPAGHAVTWAALVAGTLLHGTDYPFATQDTELSE